MRNNFDVQKTGHSKKKSAAHASLHEPKQALGNSPGHRVSSELLAGQKIYGDIVSTEIIAGGKDGAMFLAPKFRKGSASGSTSFAPKFDVA